MKIVFVDASEYKKYRMTKELFLAFFFQNMLEVTSDDLRHKGNWQIKERYNISKCYRDTFKFHNYSIVQIWKNLHKAYYKNWDNIHWWSIQMDKDKALENFMIKNLK